MRMKLGHIKAQIVKKSLRATKLIVSFRRTVDNKRVIKLPLESHALISIVHQKKIITFGHHIQYSNGNLLPFRYTKSRINSF